MEGVDGIPDGGLTNANSFCSDLSDPCCQSLLSPNSSSNTDALNTSLPINNSAPTLGELLLQHEDIAGNPSRTDLMQRFLAQLQQNPNDAQLQHFFQLLLAGPEFAPPRQRLRHVTHLTDVIRLLRLDGYSRLPKRHFASESYCAMNHE